MYGALAAIVRVIRSNDFKSESFPELDRFQISGTS
jgi:hypothetical protein